MDYPIIKSLHLIFVVSWFAGLFYMVRLFIYHVEAQAKPETERRILSEQFIIMQRKLWWIITTPAMVLTVVFGTWMLILNEALLQMDWMQYKLGFVGLLIVYHFMCQHIMRQFKKGIFNWKSTGLRIWNEVATLFLVAIVFLVVCRSAITSLNGTLGFFGVAIGLMIAIQLYKKLRLKKNNA